MELNGIPRTFWHAASFSLIAFTVGFLFISYKSGELTIKFNQLEVRTTDTIALEQTLQKQKDSIETQKATIDNREEKVKQLEILLGKKIEELNQVKSELAELQKSQNWEVAKGTELKILELTDDKSFQESIAATREDLSSLKNQQEQQQQFYQQQQQIFNEQQQQQQQRSY